MNRFYDTQGDISLQVAPWRLPVPSISTFVLMEDIKFYSNIAGGNIVVPKGFVSDLASIPSFAWSLFMKPDDPRIELGSWIHDYVYYKKGIIEVDDVPIKITREEADRILTEEAMPELLATKFQCFMVYYSLRLFGDIW
jgi:hypothetical protein